MKANIIILLALIPLIIECSASKNATNEESMQIIRSVYNDWREAPKAGSELPEVGSNLTITVEGWPDDYVPAYVVFRGKRSFSSQIAESADGKNETVINARIIRSSSVMMEKSESMEASDRLTYIKPDGDTDFIEIEKWEEEKD